MVSRGSGSIPSATASIVSSTDGTACVNVIRLELNSSSPDRLASRSICRDSPASRFSALSRSIAVWPSARVLSAARLTSCSDTSPSRRVCCGATRSSGRSWSSARDETNSTSSSAMLTVQTPAGRLANIAWPALSPASIRNGCARVSSLPSRVAPRVPATATGASPFKASATSSGVPARCSAATFRAVSA